MSTGEEMEANCLDERVRSGPPERAGERVWTIRTGLGKRFLHVPPSMNVGREVLPLSDGPDSAYGLTPVRVRWGHAGGAGIDVTTTENVAILFTDIVGSTELSQRLSSEEADELRRRHFSILRQAIAEARGTEVKHLGDGLMVVFNSASTALGCAVSMQQGVEQNNRVTAEAVGLRVGLSVGEAAKEDGDFFGDPVVEAARLCARCSGGQILATDFVRAMAGRRNRHECRSLGGLALKGLSDPVETVEVLWEPVRSSTSSGAIPLPSRLSVRPDVGVLGRVSEMESIARAFMRVERTGRHKVVLVSGEPGLGKTTLVAESSRVAYDAGAIVLFGHSEENLAAPYQSFAEALGRYITHAPDEVLVAHVATHGSELARLVPALGDRIPDLPISKSTDADTDRFLLFAAIVGVLAIASEHQPIVLVLDDLQWCDNDSLLLLRHLAGTDVPMRLLILGTYRDSEPSTHALADALADMHRSGGVTRIELMGLDDADVMELMKATAGHDLDEDAVGLAHAISRETDGNPFFVSEVLRNLVESGAIARTAEGRWKAQTNFDPSALPESVREVIGARLLRLGKEAGRILSVAAVIGRDFDLELLSAAANSSEDDVLDVLDAASAVSLVREVADAPGRFSFSHALIQHTIYEALGPTRRARTHRTVAKALDSFGRGNFGSRVFEIAHHWQMGGRESDATQVIDACRRVAERAVELTAFDEAVQWYSEAVDRTDTFGSEDRTDLLLALGMTQIQANMLETGRATLRKAAELVHDPVQSAELALAYHGPSRVAHRDPVERSLLQNALAAINANQDVVLRARLLSHLSAFCYDDTDPNKLEIAEEAVALALTTNDPEAIFAAYRSLFWPQLGIPQHARGLLTVTDSTVAAADQMGDLQAMVEAHSMRFLARCQVGDRNGADQDRVAHLELSERSGLRAEKALALCMQARFQINSADFDAAGISSASALELAGNDESILMAYGAQQIETFRWRGELNSALEILDLAGADPAPEIENYLRVMRAVLLSETDDVESAKIDALAIEGLHNLTGIGSWTRPLELAALADVACAQKNRGLGALVLGLLSDWSGLLLQVTLVADWGPCDLYIGKLTRLLGDDESAVNQLEEALRECQGAELAIWTALTSVQLSLALAEHKSEDEKARSRLLARQGLTRAREMGLHRVQLEWKRGGG